VLKVKLKVTFSNNRWVSIMTSSHEFRDLVEPVGKEWAEEANSAVEDHFGPGMTRRHVTSHVHIFRDFWISGVYTNTRQAADMAENNGLLEHF